MKEFLEWSIGRLNQAGVDSPRMEAEVLFSGALRVGREEIFLRPERGLSASRFEEVLGRRAKRDIAMHVAITESDVD